MVRYLYIFLLSGLVLWGLPGCKNQTAPQEPQTAATNEYFNLSGFIQEQITRLNKEKPAATKKVTENNGSPEIKKVNNLDWAEELNVFLELDINKPAFRNAYTGTRQQDPQTGLTTITYHKKPDAEGSVQHLIIQTNAQGQVQALRGLQETKNFLLNTRRELQLQCHTQDGMPRLSSYRITGLQQPIIFKGLSYEIITVLQ